MPKRTESSQPPRPPLSRQQVLRAAVALADAGGLGAVTMRKLAQELGVEAMSLYHHVTNKEDILDGMVDHVFAQIELPPSGDWKAAMRRRASSVRQVLSRHRWAIGLLDSRTAPGPATLRHHDAVLGSLREAGFSIEMAAHAFAVLDSYIYGFVLQETSLPFDRPEELTEVAEAILKGLPADRYPHLFEMTTEHVMQPDYSFANELEFGLELILDGLERHRGAPSRPATPAL